MQFRPDVSPALKAMDCRIFRPEAMGLAAIIAAKERPVRSQRLNRFLTKAVS
jgi:acyl CoA:acetate/3-ketoacid CoA transferase